MLNLFASESDSDYFIAILPWSSSTDELSTLSFSSLPRVSVFRNAWTFVLRDQRRVHTEFEQERGDLVNDWPFHFCVSSDDNGS